MRSTREHRQNWSLPLSLRALAKARAAAGIEGVDEALDEAIAMRRANGCESAGGSMERRARRSPRPADAGLDAGEERDQPVESRSGRKRAMSAWARASMPTR